MKIDRVFFLIHPACWALSNGRPDLAELQRQGTRRASFFAAEHWEQRVIELQKKFIGSLGQCDAMVIYPIGDTPPCLIALDAVLKLRGSGGAREIPLENFFLDYRKTDLADDEVIESVRVPKLDDGQVFRAYKISKRYDQDISAVVGAFRLTLGDGVVTDTRIAFGGMAAIPKRAVNCEAVLTGQAWSEDTVRQAAGVIGEDFAPIDDHRASADYRLSVAENLFVRLFRDIEGVDEVELMAL